MADLLMSLHWLSSRKRVILRLVLLDEVPNITVKSALFTWTLMLSLIHHCGVFSVVSSYFTSVMCVPSADRNRKENIALRQSLLMFVHVWNIAGILSSSLQCEWHCGYFCRALGNGWQLKVMKGHSVSVFISQNFDYTAKWSHLGTVRQEQILGSWKETQSSCHRKR